MGFCVVYLRQWPTSAPFFMLLEGSRQGISSNRYISNLGLGGGGIDGPRKTLQLCIKPRIKHIWHLNSLQTIN
jgi:hypothetical protein